MFATVIPLLRTPIGVDGFDYAIPDTLSLKPGMMVRIPFRKQEHLAIVESLHATSDFANRAAEIISVREDVVFPPLFLKLLSQTAKHTFTSKPAVLKSWLRQLPKREVNQVPVYKTQLPVADVTAVWKNTPREALAAFAKKQAKTRRVLILTPWKHRAEELSRALSSAPVLTSDLAGGAAFRAWHDFLSQKEGILVSTRIGAWLSPLADDVLIDEPENDDHKNDELSPRFDSRKLALWAKEVSSVRAYGLTPPLHVQEAAPVITCPLEVIIRHPNGYSPIPFIQSDALNLLQEHAGPRIVIHGVRGTASRFNCRDCGWTATCPKCDFPLSLQGIQAVCRLCGFHEPAPATCKTCGGIDLGKALPGIERLQKKAKEALPDLLLEWRTTLSAELEAPYPEHCLVLVTDPNFLASAASEDIRRDERNAIAFRRLADQIAAKQGSLIIQTPEDSYQKWPPWLTESGYDVWRTHELEERCAFKYPPAYRLVKVIITGDKSDADTWMKQAQTLLGNTAELRGPFPVSFRTKSMKPRFICHILPPQDMVESKLISTLTPLASSAIIDLDPVAFFR